MSKYQCRDCGCFWDSQSAADECYILDDIEARDARKPSPKTTRPLSRWYDD